MGVKGVTSLAKAMSALARVDIRDADVEEAVLETLRAAAPAGCEVVWE
jgi:chorismate mutase